MKLLVVSQYFWPENFIINDIVRKLVESGNEVVVATGKPNYPDGSIYQGYSSQGVFREWYLQKIELVRIPIWPRGNGSAINLSLNYLSFVFSGLLFFPWLLRGRSFDAIVVFGVSPITQAIPAILLKWLKGAHLSVWIQDMWPESLSATGFIRSKILLGMVGLLVRWIYSCSDNLLIQSKAFYEPIAEYAGTKKLIYFPNSVDPNSIVGIADSLPLDFSSYLKSKFCVVFAGNIGKAQDVETLVQVSLLLRDQAALSLVIVGSGSKLEWIKEQKIKLKLNNLVLPGRFPPELMPELFSKASALLVTLKSEEVFARTVPSKVQAYLAAGRPIIAALQGEGSKVVHDSGAGMVCQPGDSRALADCIIRMYSLPASKREAMGKLGKMYFEENFDMNRQVEHLVSILEARAGFVGQ